MFILFLIQQQNPAETSKALTLQTCRLPLRC